MPASTRCVRPCATLKPRQSLRGTGGRRRGPGPIRPSRGAGARLADGDARRREVPRGAVPGLPRCDAVHADPSPGALSPAIEAMDIRTSPLQRIPGIFRHYRHLLPVMPLAARTWRPRDVDLVISLSHCVAKAIVPPAGVPHVCYCFTPMRYAWQARETYLEGWSHRPLRTLLARALLRRLRRWDRRTASRVTHFVAISETVRGRIARCYRRDSRVIQPPVDAAFYTPDPEGRPRDEDYLVVSAPVPYKRIDQAVAACTASGRRSDRDRRGPRAGATGEPGRPDGPLPGLAARRRDPFAPPELPGFDLPGRGGFRYRPHRSTGVRRPGDRAGRGGAAETVDNAVGRTYPDPTAEALRAVARRLGTRRLPA